MLKVSDSQMDTLGDQALAKFRARLSDHIHQVFSRPASIVGPAHVDKLIDLGIERAGEHGFDTIATVQSYVDHMIMLGADFDRDPLLTPLIAPLSNPDITDNIARMDGVFTLTMAHRQAVEGAGAMYLYQALARLNAFVRKPDVSTITTRMDLIDLFERIHPQKAAHCAQRLAPALDAAQEAQGRHALTTPMAQTVHALVALMAGSGWLDDPMFYGAAPAQRAALEDETDPGKRAEQLRAGVETYLAAVMQAARDDAKGDA